MKAYFVKDNYGEEQYAIIADSSKEAKKISIGELDCDFINLRVNLIKNVNIEGLKKGRVDHIEGLKRDMFSYVTDCDCPSCGASYVTCYKNENNKIICEKCEA